MARIYRKEDVDQSLLKDQRIAIVGYGNQGRAQALNLRDGGYRVAVGLRSDSPSRSKVMQDEIEVATIEEAVSQADIVVSLVPDEVQGHVYEGRIRPTVGKEAYLVFSHGIAVHSGAVRPESCAGVLLVAPKGPGRALRELFLDRSGLFALVAAVAQDRDHAMKTALAYAHALGCTRAGVIETTFREETEADLFGEQVVLVGGMVELARAAFEVLVDAGYQPEVAYIECLHEISYIGDLLSKYGIAEMREAISPLAAFGGVTRGPRFVPPETREEMRRALQEVRGGSFLCEFLSDHRSGGQLLKTLLSEERRHPIELAGGRVRRLGRRSPETPGMEGGSEHNADRESDIA